MDGGQARKPFLALVASTSGEVASRMDGRHEAGQTQREVLDYILLPSTSFFGVWLRFSENAREDSQDRKLCEF